MVYRVEDGTGQALGSAQRDAENHVANVADQGKRQKSLDIGLCDGAQDTHQHRGESNPHEQLVQPASGEDGGAGADNCVDADLGEQAREDCRHQRRRGGVGVRQPRLEREDGGFDAEGDEQDRENRGAGTGRDFLHAHPDLRHVHGADRGVDIAQRQHEYQRGSHRDHHVAHARAHARRGSAQRQQHVGSHEEDLKADVEVEEIACQEGHVHAHGQQHVRGQEDRHRLVLGTVANTLRDGVPHHRKQHYGRGK